MYFYAYDSYDLTAALGSTGERTLDDETHEPGFQISYSMDWTGKQMQIRLGQTTLDPRTDPPNQLQYPSAPHDQTMLTACTYHAVVAKSEKCPVIFVSGTVKPVDVKKFYQYGWDIANH